MGEVLVLLSYATSAVFVVGCLNFSVWGLRRRTQLRLLQQYPLRIRWRLMLSRDWQVGVKEDDLPVLRKLRRELLRNWLLLWMVPFAILSIASLSLSYVQTLQAQADLEESQRELQRLRERVHGEK